MRENKLMKSLFVLPSVIWILAFTIFPLGYIFYLSTHSFRFGKIRGFIGLDNFTRFFHDATVRNSVFVTVFIIFIAIASEILIGLFMAWLVDKPLRNVKIFRTIFSLPLFATPVAVAFLFITIYYEEGGPLNSILGLFGIPQVQWLSSPFWAKIATAIVDIWQWSPFCFIIFLAALQSVPQEMYEAAYLETKSRWRIFWGVSFPMIFSTFILVIILRVMEAIKIFDIPAVLTMGGPGRATEVYSLLLYRTGLKFFDLGYASTMGVVMLLVEIPLIMIIVKSMRKVVS